MLGWYPSLSTFNSKFHLLLTEVSVQGAPVSLACWVGIPVYLVLAVSFILLLTEVSVQAAPVSLACGVGIPVYLVLIVYVSSIID